MREILKNFYNREVFPLFLIIFSILILFFRILFLNQIFFGGDLTFQVFPVRMYVAEMLKNKIFPLWTPDIFCGYPLFAGGEAGVLFPFNLLFSIFPSQFTFNIFLIILPFLIGCTSTYYFYRLISLDRFSSFIGSMSYFLSGFLLFFLANPFVYCIFSLLPLKLIFLELFSREKKIIYLILIIFVMSIQFLGGNPHAVLLSFLGVVFYSVYLYSQKKLNLFKLLFILIFLPLISISLSAVQIFPMLELYKFSRAQTPVIFEFITDISASLKMLLSLFFHFGYPEEYGLNIQRLGYADVLPFILVLFSLFIKKNSFVKFLFISLLICIILSLGKYNPLYKLVLYIPVINRMRYPALFLILGFFWMSLLSAETLKEILKQNRVSSKKIYFTFKIMLIIYLSLILYSIFSYREENIYYFSLSDFLEYFFKETKIFIILTLIIFTILILYFSGKISGSYFKKIIFLYFFSTIFLTPPYLIPCLSDADYVELVREENIDKEIYITYSSIYPENPGYVIFLKRDKGIYRVYNDYKKTPLQRNLGLLYNVPCLLGYIPLHLARFEKYLTLLYEDIYVQALNIMNVKYILDRKMEGVPVGSENEIERLVYNKEISIIENKKCLPRAFFVSKYIVIENEGEILEKLADRDFNPLNYVILEENPKIVKSAKNSEGKSQVKIVKYTPVEVVIDTELKDAGFLFLSDTYYPGWKVYVNGKEDKIYRANYLFKAVYLEKGKNIVRFVYKPLSFKIGIFISILTFFILISLGVYAKIKKI